MRTGTAANGNVELFWIEEGDRGAPSVVLVAGASSSSVAWARELIDPILAAGFRVVRFDHRDVGRSSITPAHEPYTVSDMVDDIEAVLDAAGVRRAHFVGRSMGGMLTMLLALRSPLMVRTMTLVHSSPCLAAPEAEGLPGPSTQVIEALTEAAFAPPPSSRAERVTRLVAEARLLAGDRYPFDEEWVRQVAHAEVTHGPFTEPGHALAVATSESLTPMLHRLAPATLVVHGTADAVVPIEHGRLLAARIPRATLATFAGLGHELPPAVCREVVAMVLELLTSVECASTE